MREEERQAERLSGDEQKPRKNVLFLDEIQFTDVGKHGRRKFSQGDRFVKQEREHCILWRLQIITEKDEVFFGEEE